MYKISNMLIKKKYTLKIKKIANLAKFKSVF